MLILCTTSICMITVAPTASYAESCSNHELRIGPSRQLPDCRADEQVSPIDKGGFDAVSRLPFVHYPANASPNGEAFTYGGNGPFAGALSSLIPNAHFSTLTPNGWQNVELTPPTASKLLSPIVEYNFSEDLSQMVEGVVGGAALASLPVGNEGLNNVILRKADGSYTLVNLAPPIDFSPEGAECGEICFQFFDVTRFAGASSDFKHILFEINGSLAGTGAPTGFVTNLYENVDGSLRVVGVLPDEQLASNGAVIGAGSIGPTPGFKWLEITRAISADGRRVLFQANADGGQPDPAQEGLTELYDRIEGTHTIEISAPAAGAKPANPSPEPAQFWTASSDGAQVFFTSSAELTTSSNTGPANNSADLYRYDVTTGSLDDLTVDTNPLDVSSGAGVEGVLGASVDGSYIYFVANGQLINGQGIDGQPNMYVWHEDKSTHESQLAFVATLSGSDANDWTAYPKELQSYVAPDGRHAAFMSVSSLTGYDNRDRNSHAADDEVYEYSAETHTLVCGSCNPDGEPPVGGAFIGVTSRVHVLGSTAFHQPRVLSDDGGRLFFSSSNPLDPHDTSSYAKVYEYEQNGVGSCVAAGGCRYLISSGTSGEPGAEDGFLDADATGENVFFATLSRLAPTDQDNLYDVYDARVGGGFASAPAEIGCRGCTVPIAGTSQPSSPPASQLVIPPPPSPATQSTKSSSKKSKRLSCRSKAKTIRNGPARAHRLRQCAKQKQVFTNRRTPR
jgi:hypothetical protein